MAPSASNSQDEILNKPDEHAKTAHNMQQMPPEVLSKARPQSTTKPVHKESNRLSNKTEAASKMFLRGDSKRVALFVVTALLS